jgi:hypothetical protein
MRRMNLHQGSLSFWLALSTLCLLITGHAHAISVADQLTTTDPLAGTGCTKPQVQTAFSPTDEVVYLWVSVKNVVQGDKIQWRWKAPDNTLYGTSNVTFSFNGGGCAWAGMQIKGEAAAGLEGNWGVEVYLNGSLATTGTFSIGKAAPTQTGGGAAQLDLAVNDQIWVPWGYVNLSYQIKSFQPGLRVDLYLVLIFHGGGYLLFGPGPSFTTDIIPFASNLVLSNDQATIIAGFLSDQVGSQILTLYGILVAQGKSVLDPANWVSNLAVLNLALGPLSSSQTEIIANQGNPQAYIINLDHNRQQRRETWIYQKGDMGHNFEFINGAQVGVPLEGQRATGADGPPTRYDPGRFSPSTTPKTIRDLLGDPDHVIQGAAPGRVAWVYNSAGVTVTFANGVVLQIEVY